jgi:dTDP-4-amino-4,6-dideoxy-D-galactose acyltransferase
MNPHFNILDWDTWLFGFRVARVLPLPPHDVPQMVAALRSDNVRLAYWAIPPEDTALSETAVRVGAQPVDRKTLFTMSLGPGNRGAASPNISSYESREASEALVRLGVQAGEFSRFKRDALIPQQKFEELYTHWILKSVSGELADGILTYNVGNGPVGLITLKATADAGNIILFAVDANYRGRRIGQELIEASKHYYHLRGFHTLRVVTQGHNEAACNLYRKCGFQVAHVEDYYHLWL